MMIGEMGTALNKIAALFVAAWALTATTHVYAQCTVADKTGTPLNLRDSPAGGIIGTLPNGLTVVFPPEAGDQSKDKWVYVSDFTGASLGYVHRSGLKCKQMAVDRKYPLILSYEQLEALGLFMKPDMQTGGKSCFYSGDGVIYMGLSRARLAKLAADKTSFEAFCMVSRVADFKFDPESGRRLKTFMVAEERPKSDTDMDAMFAFELPLEVPRCMRRGRVKKIHAVTNAMKLRGCAIRFNPFTGEQITEADKAVLLGNGIFLDGGAGGSQSEASLVSVRGKRQATKAEAKKLAEELAE